MGNEKPKFVTFRDLHSLKQNAVAETPSTDTETNSVINVDFEQQSVSANQSLYTKKTLDSVSQALSDQQTQSVHLTLTNNINGYTSIPNLILDGLIPILRVQEQAVYLRLYRLSHGFHIDTCRIGFEKLAQNCNLSRREVIRCIEKLEQLGLIVRLGCNFKSPNNAIRGNLYQVNLPKLVDANQSLNANQSPSDSQTPSANQSPNKHDDDHDDLKKQDHHQSNNTSQITEHQKSVMMIYQKITGNNWTKTDLATYQKIKNIPLESIEIAIRLATQRASSRPNSLAFFVKEIIATANPKTNRSKQKKSMEKIVDRVRNALVGSSHSMSDFVYRVKELCLREDIAFDNDLLDELLAKKNS